MKNLLVLSICTMLFITCKKAPDLIESETDIQKQYFSQKSKRGKTSKKDKKVNICHKGKIINVSVNSISSHKQHGDAVDMDGDGYFDKANKCSALDCDDNSYSTNNSCNTASVGDFVNGGIVFYIAPSPTDLDGNGTLDIGLVCSPSDQSSGIPWNNGSFLTTGATGLAIGTGSSNTDSIITTQGPVATNYAAGLAKSYTGGGFNDWFLPSKDELNQMYLSKGVIDAGALSNGGTAFGAGAYWSSSDTYNPSFAWFQWFNNGAQSSTNKFASISMRAIRAF